MKFVFFVHYFPPLNSTGARRIESFAKYLSRNGHEIAVISTRKSTRDGPLTELVPPYVRLYQIDAFGRISEASREAAVQVSAGKRIHWTRRFKQLLMPLFGQLLDPRIGFAFGIRSRHLAKAVTMELSSADLFVSSFPPWPAHLAALFAQRRFGKPWIADYRDQFSSNHFMSGRLSAGLESVVDRFLLKRPKAITVISEPMKTYYSAMHPCVVCIENGYDREIFDRVRATLKTTRSKYSISTVPVVRYLGTITRDRIPMTLLEALELIAGEAAAGAEPLLRVEFFGDTRLLEDYVRLHHPDLLGGWLSFLPPVPYERSIEAMLTADALFFVETSDLSSLSAQGVLTTKLFEYLASGRQIIAEIDEGVLAATYIKEASSMHVISRNVDTLSIALRKLCQTRLEIEENSFVANLSRERKAQQFEQLALETIGKSGQR